MVNVLYLQEHTLCLFEFSKTSNLQIAVFLIQCGNTFYWQPMLNPQRCGLIKSLQQNTLEQNGQNQFTNTFFFSPFCSFLTLSACICHRLTLRIRCRHRKSVFKLVSVILRNSSSCPHSGVWGFILL